MDNYNKLEAYFNNELTAAEEEQFLHEVENNAELRAEYNFQQEVVNGIKEARKAELKAMLDQVPVAGIGTASTGVIKALVTGASALLIGTIAWYYFNTPQSPKATLQSTTSHTVQNEPFQPSPAEKMVTKPENNEVAELEKTKSPAATKKEPTHIRAPKVITPQLPTPAEDIKNEAFATNELDVPSSAGNNSINLNSKINVEVKLRKKYNFHYQYNKANLVLYGEFEDGLFEILEVNKEQGKEIYLFFDNNYYFLSNHTGNITPLKPIKDKALIAKLTALRK